MRMWMVVVALGLAAVRAADGAVMCQKKSGVVVVRETCKPKETAVSASVVPFSDTLASGKTLRGTFFMTVDAAASDEEIGASISFGLQLPSEPTVHLIAAGATPPAECPGTPAAPAAQPGHVCVFEAAALSVTGQGLCTPDNCGGSPSNRYGVLMYAFSTAAGTVQWGGTWAVTAP